MIKFGVLALCLSGMLYGMEDKNKENMLQMYNRDILPQMPAYTKVTLEKGAATLTKLVQTSFNSKDPDWKFKDIFYWMRINAKEAHVQIDIAILKRYVAAIIDKAEDGSNLCELGESLVQNKDSLRWVITGDNNSAVSDNLIQERWQKFMSIINESAGLDL